MKQHVCRKIEDFPVIQGGCVVAIGNFDGLHLGHQLILQKASELASQEGLPLVVMTFDPTPVKLLRPDKAPRTIMPLVIKQRLFADYCIDHLIVVETTEFFLATEDIDFVEKILVKKLNFKHIVEGQTFNFGKRGAGTMVTLAEMAESHGFKTHLVGSMTRNFEQIGSVAICSTLIRQLLATCQFELATICMGRPFTLGGVVVPNRQKGRTLGFPTANFSFYCDDQLIPDDGVFVGWVRWGSTAEAAWDSDQKYMAAVSIGSCETFEDGNWQVEAHILDFPSEAPELADQHILLEFVDKLRDQQRFKSPEDLVEAMERDCRRARQRLLKK